MSNDKSQLKRQAVGRGPQHEEDGVLYCDEHGTYQCRACGHDPQLKRLEDVSDLSVSPADYGEPVVHSASRRKRLDGQGAVCASYIGESLIRCALDAGHDGLHAGPAYPTPPTPAGEEVSTIQCSSPCSECGLRVPCPCDCHNRQPPATPEADGGKRGQREATLVGAGREALRVINWAYYGPERAALEQALAAYPPSEKEGEKS